MSASDREHLLGYLLGALDDDEHRQVEQALERSPELRRQLSCLEHRLKPLSYDREHHAPPPGLARRTCSWLATQMDVALCQPETTGSLPGPSGEGNQRAARVRLRERREGAKWYSWSLADLLVSAGIAMVAAMLFFPAITHSRHRAQVLSCQQHLQQVGLGLQTFAMHHQGQFPQEVPDGPWDFAGIYGTELVEGQYLVDERQLLCPSSVYQAMRNAWRVPRKKEIAAARNESERRHLQLSAGGDFAYSLGCFIGGKFVGPRDNRRPYFPVLADAPSVEDGNVQIISHSGRGHNVLYEDGHVHFTSSYTPINSADHIFYNADGVMRAGKHVRDSVLAPGFVKP